MKLYLAKEFSEDNWYPDYKKLKKKLRNSKVPFTVRKLPTENGLLHSIWSSEEHIDRVRDIVSRHYLKDPKVQIKIKRVEALSSEFEEKWMGSFLFSLMATAIKRPLLFTAAAIVVVAMCVYPFFKY